MPRPGLRSILTIAGAAIVAALTAIGYLTPMLRSLQDADSPYALLQAASVEGQHMPPQRYAWTERQGQMLLGLDVGPKPARNLWLLAGRTQPDGTPFATEDIAAAGIACSTVEGPIKDLRLTPPLGLYLAGHCRAE